jgi:hypothetical protein
MPSRASRQPVRPAPRPSNATELTEAAARVGQALAERDPRCDAYFLEPADLVTAGDLRATWQLAAYGQVMFRMLAESLGYTDHERCTARTLEEVLFKALDRIEDTPVPPCRQAHRAPAPAVTWEGTVSRLRQQLDARRPARANARRRRA